MKIFAIELLIKKTAKTPRMFYKKLENKSLSAQKYGNHHFIEEIGDFPTFNSLFILVHQQ